MDPLGRLIGRTRARRLGQRASRWWWQHRIRRVRLARSLVALVAGLVLASILGEVALRLPFLPLPDDLSTYLFQCYGLEYPPSRAAFFAHPIGIDVMKPDFDCGCAWSGYRWHHRTDAYGGRNPQTWEHPDVVLLGDSIVYGHGVEESQTFGHLLRDRLHRTVVNLAYMGQCPVQYVAMMRNFALPRRPRVVVMVLFQNDLEDIYSCRTVEQIRHFITTGDGLEARSVPLDRIFSYDRDPRGWRRFTWRWLAHRWLAARTIGFYARRWAVTHRLSREPRPVEFPVGPDPAASLVPSPGEALALDYTRRATRSMARWAADAGCSLVVAYIPGLTRFTYHSDRVISQAAGEMAAQLELPFLDLTTALSARDGVPQPGVLLARDGHLSPAGHERVARAVAAFLTERHLLDR